MKTNSLKSVIFNSVLVTVLCCNFPFAIIGQSNPVSDNCACCTEHHRGFDFWVGDWVVTDTLGNLLGQSTITRLEDGCIIAEVWSGAQGGSGHSFNYYDQQDSTWNQLWISNTGGVLKLKGDASKDQMQLTSEVNTTGRVSFRNRITWSRTADDSVIQRWDLITPEGDEVLQTTFYGVYTKNE